MLKSLLARQVKPKPKPIQSSSWPGASPRYLRSTQPEPQPESGLQVESGSEQSSSAQLSNPPPPSILARQMKRKPKDRGLMIGLGTKNASGGLFGARFEGEVE